MELLDYSCYNGFKLEGDYVVCKKCGKALSNAQATCPFCGALMTSEQLTAFANMKRESEKDLRAKLISEQYGIKPIKYELHQNQISDKWIIFLVICGVLGILFLVVLLIFF